MPAPLLLAATEKASGLQSVWEFLATGGFVMGLLVICSMAAITAMINAWLHLPLRLTRHLVNDRLSVCILYRHAAIAAEHLALDDIRPVNDRRIGACAEL
jgi:hypothetical protein